MTRRIVSAVWKAHATPVVFCDDGAVFQWRADHDNPAGGYSRGQWYELMPVPGTPRDVAVTGGETLIGE